MVEEKFEGRVTIRVKFRNRLEYEKFRKEILKTEWTYDIDYPLFEELKLDFHNTDDIANVNKHVIYLLQMGFEVYCCRYQLESHLAEAQHPPEGDLDEDIYDEPEIGEFDFKKICDDLWREAMKGLRKR